MYLKSSIDNTSLMCITLYVNVDLIIIRQITMYYLYLYYMVDTIYGRLHAHILARIIAL